ncbi:MAG: hypothetical protein HYZ53_09355 [Planctomycetes bacterium]|nr:hypothetical protein [Planctomycetota bacterium]
MMRLRFAACVLLVGLWPAFASPARAQEEVRVEVEAGLGGSARENHLVPVRVTVGRPEVDNRSRGAVDKPLEVDVTVGGGAVLLRPPPDRLTFERVSVDPGGRKAADGVAVLGPLVSWWTPRRNATRSAGYRSISSDEGFFVVTLGGTPGWLQFLEGHVTFNGAADAPRNAEEAVGRRHVQAGPGAFAPGVTLDVVVVSPPPAALPASYLGYHSAELVVVGDPAGLALSPAQADALRLFVVSGGALLFMGGPAGAAAAKSPFAALLPGPVLEPADRPSLAPYASALGLTGAFPEGAVVTLPLGAGPGEVLLRTSEGEAFVWRRRYGLGYVLYTSLELGAPPLAGWERAWEVWVRLLSRCLPPQTHARGCTGKAFPADASPAEIHPPGRGFVVAFLLVYVLVVGPLNFGVLRALDRSEWLWLSTPALILLFFAGSFSFAFVGADTLTVVRKLTVVRAEAGEPLAASTTFVRVFSARGQAVSLAVEDPLAAIRLFEPPDWAGSGVPESALGKSVSGVHVGPISLVRWAERDFYVDGVAVAPDVETMRSAAGGAAGAGGRGPGKYLAAVEVQPFASPEVRWEGGRLPRLSVSPGEASWSPGLGRVAPASWLSGVESPARLEDPVLAGYIGLGALDGEFLLAASEGATEGAPRISVEARRPRVSEKTLWIVHLPRIAAAAAAAGDKRK